MFREMLVEAVIRSAITLEEQAHEFYEEGRSGESEPEVRELFGRLAGEESRHRERLEDLLKADLGEVLSVDTRKLHEIMDVPGGKRGREGERGGLSMTVLRRALEREVASYNFYAMLAKRALLPVLKQTFHLLATEEEIHVRRIRTLIDGIEEGAGKGR